MKKIMIVVLVSLFGSLVSMEVKVAKKPKALLFDLGGIFYDKSAAEYGKQMGVNATLSALGYLLWDWKAPWAVKSLFFEVLDHAEIEDKDETLKPAHDKKGKPFPYLLTAYQAGRYTTEQAKELAMAAFNKLEQEGHFCSTREAALVKRAIELAFSPELYAKKIIKAFPEALQVLQDLRTGSQECKLIALSNWDKESFQFLKKRFPELSLFDDLVISGEIGSVKPNRAIFDSAVERAGVPADQCLFIDDQQENLDAAEKFGIPSLLYTNAAKLRKDLEDKELLPRQEKSSESSSRIPLGIAFTLLLLSTTAWLVK